MDDWTHKPEAVGWYATLICWDPVEGFFPHADYWNGSKWESPVVQCSLKLFDTEREAEAWAYEHNPDGPSEPPDQSHVTTFLVLGPEFNILKGGTFTVKIN